MKKTIAVVLALTSVYSYSLDKEVIFFNEHTIHEVKFKEQDPNKYFDFLTCGSYHCYGIKGETLYAAGFNGQGQLGLYHKESKAQWTRSMKNNVSWVRSTNFGGCLKTKDGKLFETGRFDISWIEEIKNPKNGWVEVDSCKKTN